jgi:predicted GTPase
MSVGKSSVINMILGSDKAKVGNSLRQETLKDTVYPVEIDGKTYNLHDTVGLGEYSGSTVVDRNKLSHCDVTLYHSIWFTEQIQCII